MIYNAKDFKQIGKNIFNVFKIENNRKIKVYSTINIGNRQFTLYDSEKNWNITGINYIKYTITTRIISFRHRISMVTIAREYCELGKTLI